MSPAREQLGRWLAEEADAQVEFLRAFLRVDTANPPGDTREGVRLVGRFLASAGLPWRIVDPEPSMPNLIGSFEGFDQHHDDERRNAGEGVAPRRATGGGGRADGRHLVLNGHVDVFPIGERAAWRHDPLGAALVEGRIYGRGAVDMKCGTTASLFTYAYLHRLRAAWRGRVTLTVVSDEETGGRLGSAFLVDRHGPEVLGDCLLNGEPSSRHTVRFAEKSILWLRFEVAVPGGHSAYPHLSSSANRIAARLVADLERLESLEPEPPPAIRDLLARPEVRRAMDLGLGPGAADVAGRLTLNVGTLHGGAKVNMLPARCVLEVDCRLPIGLARERVMAAVGEILAGYPEVTVAELLDPRGDPAPSDPHGEMVSIIQRNALAVTGIRPLPIVNLGATDCRFWRERGVPAYVYGCSPEGMGAADESVAIEEFLQVVRVHALSAFDYLAGG